jgi:hypothetical protein
MTSFLSDWWEAFVISGCYEMEDPLAPSEVEGTREGAGIVYGFWKGVCRIEHT